MIDLDTLTVNQLSFLSLDQLNEMMVGTEQIILDFDSLTSASFDTLISSQFDTLPSVIARELEQLAMQIQQPGDTAGQLLSPGDSAGEII